MDKQKAEKINKNIKLISDRLLRTEVKHVILKHKLSKIPDSFEKQIILKEYLEAERNLNHLNLEFGLMKFFYSYVKQAIPRGK